MGNRVEYIYNLGAIIAGLALLVAGGEFIVKGSVTIARRFSVPDMVIGLTIVALGTSAPEIVVSIKAALDNHPDIALGNVVGSNITNIFLVLGMSAVVSDVLINKKAATRDLPFLLILCTIFLAMCYDDSTLTTIDGLILIAILIMFIAYTIRSTKKSNKKDREEKEKFIIEQEIKEEIESDGLDGKSVPKAIFYIILSIALLAGGAECLLFGSVSFAKAIGISEATIGLTIVAIGSSAPELATCIVASYRKHSDLIAGNIIGSNLLNIMGGLGIAATLSPLKVSESFISTDNWILLASTIAFAICALIFNKINRIAGFFLILGYIGFISIKF